MCRQLRPLAQSPGLRHQILSSRNAHARSPLSRNPNLPLTEEEWQLLQSFHEELDKDVLEECRVCQERWFNMDISGGICARCRRRDKNRAEDEPELFSKDNLMDPGSVPEHLPALTQVEEMLIARVHVCLEVRQIRGQQYKYTGHIINFLRDVGKVYRKLPLLPQDLEIVLLRPAGSSANPRIQRQFSRDFRVRREAVRVWLEYLQTNHPGYLDIDVDNEVLSQLPDDGTVIDSIATEETDEPHSNADEGAEVDADDDDEEPAPIVTAVPDLLQEEQELEQLRQQVQRSQNLPP
jgi:hypothetical protein